MLCLKQPFMGISRLCTYALLLCSLVHGQYIQEYQYMMRNGQQAPFWRRTALDTPNFVVIPQNIVALYYNCHFMPAICQNNINWLNTNRGRTRSLAAWAGAAGSNIYGFDVNSASTDPRGDRMCNRTWIRDHPCPERHPVTNLIVQPDVMPGPWPYKSRETVDPLHINEIAADWSIDANGDTILLQRSGRYYTCEEWPPRSFVEGGEGTPNQNVFPEGDGGRGNTFCAPQLINSNCADEAPQWDEAIKSEQDWQGNAHRVVATRLRAIARQEGGRTTQAELDHTAVLVSLLFFNDPNEPPAGFKMGPGGSTSYDVKLYKDTKRADNYVGHLSPKEQIRAMASLTWEQVRQWGGPHYAVQLNGTVTSSNITDAFADEKAAVDEYSSKGGAYMNDQGLQFVSNESFPGITTSPNSTLSHLRFAVSNASTNATEASNVTQRGHREPRAPIPYDPLSLGTAYILGNIGDFGDLSSHQNNSKPPAEQERINSTISDRSVSESRRSHFRRHAGSHINQVSHQHGSTKLGLVSSGESIKQPLGTGFTPFTHSLHKRDGPIQCGPGSPCKDDSCCSAEGKCGYKEHNCGAGCTSNCDAKAMCGIDSADGKTKCGLNLCCSYYGWCGTEDVHCYDPEPQFGKTPCQQGFGSCQKYPSPSCSGRSASTGRRVGYYQGWNVRERKCDKVSPSQINTKGLTHLFYSFVFFDPSTFNIIPMNDADPSMYREFTKLSTNGLQTWVAIGGWSFSDPGIYHTAWSDMCSSAANRAAFIKSTIAFMDEYGFQGADLDWEYPEDAKRGGKPGDADNLVLLVKEMQAAFAGRFGLSLTLAPDYWYLRGFKPKAMEPYVDFMGFMR
ncbi:hypothetical protein FB567DRAFT_251587 [Paraphoma chrysanthemicola]|uniref:chitinase n=1 Tax=Paraphoma chrysanthemicola TaxID=798071 RepID=A0A8K0VRP7_9PLEO|nr:hypothetical protein FB567DRAFT_251587 [Paraphoma chrysanthemicola]